MTLMMMMVLILMVKSDKSFILFKTTDLEKKSQETAALYLRQKYPIRAEYRRRKVAP